MTLARSIRRFAPVLVPLFAAAMFAAGAARAQETKDAPSDSADSAEERYVHVKLTTNQGDIVLELDQEKAPISVKNFLNYVDKGFYNGTVFHRVIPDFMAQAGGFTDEGGVLKQKTPEAPIKNEWQNGLKNVRGSIAMARTSVPDSATSQFFINVADNAFLDTPRQLPPPPDTAAYAVFGKVIEGMDVVDKIVAVPTTTKGAHKNVPVNAVIVEKAERIKG